MRGVNHEASMAAFGGGGKGRSENATIRLVGEALAGQQV